MFQLSLFVGKKDDTSRAEIISVTITPNQPKKGDKVEISFKFLMSMLNKLLILYVLIYFLLHRGRDNIWPSSCDPQLW